MSDGESEAGEMLAGLKVCLLILHDPRRAYAELSRREGWGAPFLLCTAVTGAAAILTWPYVKHILIISFPPDASQTHVDAVLRGASRTMILAPMWAGITLALRWVLEAGVVFLVVIAVSGWMSFKKSMTLIAHSFVPICLGIMPTVFVLWLKGFDNINEAGDLLVAYGPNLFLEDPAGIKGALAKSIDLFAVWRLVLLGMGLKAMAGLRVPGSLIVVLAFWSVETCVAICGVLLKQSLPA
jgi:hypothetical protein